MARIKFINIRSAKAIESVGGYDVVAHGENCSDIARFLKKWGHGADADTAASEFATAAEADAEFNADDLGLAIKFYPCCNFGGTETKAESTPVKFNLTRKEMLNRLAELGYTGPTSYLKPRLGEILAEQIVANATK